MTQHPVEYDQCIQQSYQRNNQSGGRALLRFWLLLFASASMLTAIAYGLHFYWSVVATDILIIALIVSSLLFITPLCVACNTWDCFRLSQRNSAEDLLRLDLYHGSRDGLLLALADVIPGLQKNQRSLNSLEALLKETDTLNARYARIIALYTKQSSDMNLADSVHQWVQQSLAADQLAANNTTVQAFLDRHAPLAESDPTNVTPLWRDSE